MSPAPRRPLSPFRAEVLGHHALRFDVQLNGKMEIDSEVGAGTTVTIELPTVVG